MSHNRHHRYRSHAGVRAILEETKLHRDDLVMPVFVREDITGKHAISTLPGIDQVGLDVVMDEVKEIVELGIRAIIVFGIPKNKSANGEAAFEPDGVVQRAIRQIRGAYPELVIIADCCMCQYTPHGQCGVLTHQRLDNNKTLAVLGKIAVSYAEAGCDMVAPSGMIDGMVGQIRGSLDTAGYPLVSIMSYAVKYASAFYGPFRDAAGSSSEFVGDRKHHQMNPTQRNEAFLEAQQDLDEGADILMVKPALSYLDIIRDLKNEFDLPVAAYHVSGTYSMMKAASKNGLLDEEAAFMEALVSMKRAGASLIITYYAKQAARLIQS